MILEQGPLLAAWIPPVKQDGGPPTLGAPPPIIPSSSHHLSNPSPCALLRAGVLYWPTAAVVLLPPTLASDISQIPPMRNWNRLKQMTKCILLVLLDSQGQGPGVSLSLRPPFSLFWLCPSLGGQQSLQCPAGGLQLRLASAHRGS